MLAVQTILVFVIVPAFLGWLIVEVITEIKHHRK
jgi:hypothetical protein